MLYVLMTGRLDCGLRGRALAAGMGLLVGWLDPCLRCKALNASLISLSTRSVRSLSGESSLAERLTRSMFCRTFWLAGAVGDVSPTLLVGPPPPPRH